ncbi:uncharacterized protein LOC134329371 [Trichomycterus rosablanca]|uniref:uncharacterized protein LOC134329371 n=1 Tax=Trichomycterus rosablanca TaxID=2290929 RepID=UPI002F359322
MKLVGAALVLLAISGCSTEVVQDFTSCGDFFANPDEVASPPTRFYGSQYKQICQTLEGEVKYATFYDTTNKILVYSAYRFLRDDDCKKKARKDSWFIEPQLYQPNEDRNMALQGRVPYWKCGIEQALNRDYARSGYDRGHLAPVSHTNTQSCSDATFTLTNAAPQDPKFNKGQWWKTELEVSGILQNECLNRGLSAYIVTGVVPGNKNINNRVNVPSYFWTAYCCLDNNKKPKVSGGYYGANVNNPVNKVSVSVLESFLSNEYKNGPFKLFGTGCYVNDRGSTEAFNLDRSRTGLFIKKDYDRGFGSASSRERSRIERICAQHFASASSMPRSPIEEHYPRRYAPASFRLRSPTDERCARYFAFANSGTRLRFERMCANRYGFASSRLGSPVEEDHSGHFGFANSRPRSRTADICGRYFHLVSSRPERIEEDDDY